MHFMCMAYDLAKHSESVGEVPVGAVVVMDDAVIGKGWNQPISHHDPSAHAEIMALRDAGKNMENYRLPGTCLYVTLEPCVMCAGAIVHARVDTVIYAASDPRAGAAGSCFNMLPSDQRFNHHTACIAGVMADECSALLKDFFKRRRAMSS